MSLFCIFARYEWNEPTYFIGAFKDEKTTKHKMEKQYQWDMNNDNSIGWNPYFIKKLSVDTLPYERDDFGIKLDV